MATIRRLLRGLCAISHKSPQIFPQPASAKAETSDKDDGKDAPDQSGNEKIRQSTEIPATTGFTKWAMRDSNYQCKRLELRTTRPLVVQSSELGAPWQQIRTLISDCSDLPLEARQSMVTQGDEAAVIASKASRRDSQQDQQA